MNYRKMNGKWYLTPCGILSRGRHLLLDYMMNHFPDVHPISVLCERMLTYESSMRGLIMTKPFFVSLDIIKRPIVGQSKIVVA